MYKLYIYKLVGTWFGTEKQLIDTFRETYQVKYEPI